ncbi:MAG: hypothetical protein IJY47_06350 [Clostridia bacterium]|nr:hypothetical protein [Clostridia bacterium]
MKKFIFILAVIVVLGCLIVGIGIALNQPERVAERALAGLAEDLTSREEVEALVKPFEKGSVAFTGTADASDAEFGGKIYFNSKKSTVMAEDLYYSQGESLNLTGSLYISEDKSYLSNDEILKGTYGIERGEMMSALKSSIFRKDAKSEVALSESTYDLLAAMMQMYDIGADKEMKEEWDKIVTRYGKKLYSILEEYAEFESETRRIKIGEERKKARVITVTVDTDAFLMMQEELFYYVSNDKKLESFVETYGGYYEEYLWESGLIGSGRDISDVYETWIKNWEDSLDEDELSYAGNDEELVIKLVTGKLSSTLMKLELHDDSNGFNLALDVGTKGLAKSENITCTLNGTKWEYSVDDEDPTKFGIKLLKNEETLLNFHIDKEKDTYRLTLGNGSLTMRGDWKKTGLGELQITVDKILYVKEGKSVTSDLTLVLDVDMKDNMPKPKADMEIIFDLSEDEIKQIEKRVNELGEKNAFIGTLVTGLRSEKLFGSYSNTFLGQTTTLNFFGTVVILEVEDEEGNVSSAVGQCCIENGQITLEFDDEAWTAPYTGSFLFTRDEVEKTVTIGTIEYQAVSAETES